MMPAAIEGVGEGQDHAGENRAGGHGIPDVGRQLNSLILRELPIVVFACHVHCRSRPAWITARSDIQWSDMH